MYSPKSKLTPLDSLRAAMFNKVDPQSLPLTIDALHCHLLRCLYQVIKWWQATIPNPVLPNVLQSGWKVNANGNTVPVLMTKDPMPSNCTELLTCNCKTGCNRRCTCKHMKMPCTEACGCAQQCLNPFLTLTCMIQIQNKY